MDDTPTPPISTRDVVGTEGLLALSNYANAVSTISRMFMISGRIAGGRLTARQMRLFCLIADAYAQGEPLTMNEATAKLGEPASDSIKTLLPPRLDAVGKPLNPKDTALGLVEQVPDRMDMRRRYLRLTEAGREIIEAMAEVIS